MVSPRRPPPRPMAAASTCLNAGVETVMPEKRPAAPSPLSRPPTAPTAPYQARQRRKRSNLSATGRLPSPGYDLWKRRDLGSRPILSSESREFSARRLPPVMGATVLLCTPACCGDSNRRHATRTAGASINRLLLILPNSTVRISGGQAERQLGTRAPIAPISPLHISGQHPCGVQCALRVCEAFLRSFEAP